MSELLIVLALTAVGKIHGQGAVASQVLQLKPLPVIDHQPVSYFEQQRFQTPTATPRLYTNAFRPTVHENSQDNGSDNIDFTPTTVRGTEPKRRLFTSVRVPAEMYRPSEITETASSRSRYHSADIKKENNVKEDRVLTSNDNVNYVVPPEITNNPNKNVTTVTHKINPDKIPSVVDVDERSSFDGDMCPPGSVRIKGVCVQKD
ncbi:unnamed protein product [Arctia plantaginis]|uniref:Uncharacterized protein n=1 Tax=Arctia plantaginis TaxID=874455 RepID=A0A8S0ZS04_ARCPL|nr:unnamed protein product [Arctia plantaginis]